MERSWQEKKALLEKVCGYTIEEEPSQLVDGMVVRFYRDGRFFSGHHGVSMETAVNEKWVIEGKQCLYHHEMRAYFDKIAPLFGDDL